MSINLRQYFKKSLNAGKTYESLQADPGKSCIVKKSAQQESSIYSSPGFLCDNWEDDPLSP